MTGARTMDEAIALFEKLAPDNAMGFLVPLECSLEDAEKQLGMALPPSYHEFLEKGEPTQIPARDIVSDNRDARIGKDAFYCPEFLVAFFYDGMGNHYCFDTRFPGDDREYPIVFWDHEIGPEEQIRELKKTDACFTNWLLRYSQQIPVGSPSGGAWVGIGCLVAIVIVVILVAVGAVSIFKILVP